MANFSFLVQVNIHSTLDFLSTFSPLHDVFLLTNLLPDAEIVEIERNIKNSDFFII